MAELKKREITETIFLEEVELELQFKDNRDMTLKVGGGEVYGYLR